MPSARFGSSEKSFCRSAAINQCRFGNGCQLTSSRKRDRFRCRCLPFLRRRRVPEMAPKDPVSDRRRFTTLSLRKQRAGGSMPFAKLSLRLGARRRFGQPEHPSSISARKSRFPGTELNHRHTDGVQHDDYRRRYADCRVLPNVRCRPHKDLRPN
jgi:hypothetical protein